MKENKGLIFTLLIIFTVPYFMLLNHIFNDLGVAMGGVIWAMCFVYCIHLDMKYYDPYDSDIF